MADLMHRFHNEATPVRRLVANVPALSVCLTRPKEHKQVKKNFQYIPEIDRITHMPGLDATTVFNDTTLL